MSEVAEIDFLWREFYEADKFSLTTATGDMIDILSARK